MTPEERRDYGISQPPVNGVEQRLEAILTELRQIRQALERPVPEPESIREPGRALRKTTR